MMVCRPKNRKNTSTRHPTHLASASPESRSGKRLTASLISYGLIFFLAGFARAGNATWDMNPSSGDWDTAVNWTLDTVPNGPSDTATFGASNTTNVSISSDTQVSGITFSPAATSNYIIATNPGVTLTISGTGITNNSGIVNGISNGPFGGDFEHPSRLLFLNHATVGTAAIFNSGGVRFRFTIN